MTADLTAAREAQMRRKLMAQAIMAEVEHTEFRRVLEVNKEKQMQDMSQVSFMTTLNPIPRTLGFVAHLNTTQYQEPLDYVGHWR